jgi:hypothetical protein
MTKFIKNIDCPSCKNCVYYIQGSFGSFGDDKCGLFGQKDLINDKIVYRHAESCRNDSSKCGIQGNHFKKAIITRKIVNKMLTNAPYVMPFAFLAGMFLAKL